jgi:hypothetical protein
MSRLIAHCEQGHFVYLVSPQMVVVMQRYHLMKKVENAR